MRTSAVAACVAILAVAVPLARADVGDPDYEEPAAATAQTEPDYETSDYVESPLPEVAVDPTTPMPEMTVDAVAPGPIPTMAPTPADGPTPSAVEPAGPPMEVDEMWEECLTKLGGGNSTHSLEDIVTGPFEERNGGPSVFLPLLAKLDDETLELLMEFDLSGEGYTLILPTNTARDFNATGPQATRGPVFEVYDFDANATTSAEFTEVIQAHVLPGTITFNSISAELEANDTYTVTSLQGYEWTFALADGGKLVDAGNSSATGNSTGTYPVLVDNHNITADGFFNIEADIRKVAECPNAVISSTDGFFAAPQYLTAPVEAPTPAPAPAPVDVPAPAPAPAPVAEAPEPAPETPEEPAPEAGSEGEAGASPDSGSDDAGAAAGAGVGLIAATAAAVAALTMALL